MAFCLHFRLYCRPSGHFGTSRCCLDGRQRALLETKRFLTVPYTHSSHIDAGTAETRRLPAIQTTRCASPVISGRQQAWRLPERGGRRRIQSNAGTTSCPVEPRHRSRCRQSASRSGSNWKPMGLAQSTTVHHQAWRARSRGPGPATRGPRASGSAPATAVAR